MKNRTLLMISILTLLFLARLEFFNNVVQGQPHEQVGTQGNKIKVKLVLTWLQLNYAGDSKDTLRGDTGEIWIYSKVTWDQNNAEKNKTQITRLGGQNKYEKWKDGENRTINETLYHNEADCPVIPRFDVEFFVWDDDNAKSVEFIKKAIDKAAEKATGTKGAKDIIDEVIGGGRTDLASYNGWIPKEGNFHDPCLLEEKGSGEFTGSVDLDKSGPEGEGGKIGYKILYSKKTDKSGYESARPGEPPPTKYTGLDQVDFGQADEATLAITFTLNGSIPFNPLVEPGDWLIYEGAIDVDNNMSTGAGGGEDYKVVVTFEETGFISKLLHWTDGRFEEIIDGIYSFGMNIDRKVLYVAIELDTLGSPSGPTANWAIINASISGYPTIDILPSGAPTQALILPLYYGFSGEVPTVIGIGPHDGEFDVRYNRSISITFNKAMDRDSVEVAFSITPAIFGLFSWEGNTLIFTPSTQLAPFTQYTIAIDQSATDRASVPLGSTFTSSFFTEPLQLYTSTSEGIEKRTFLAEEPIYVTGQYFPSNTLVDIYVVVHTIFSENENIYPVNDVVTVSTDGYGNLPLTLIWYAPSTGEFNVVVDVNRDGFFQYAIDRIDRTKTGFVSFTSVGGVLILIDKLGLLAPYIALAIAVVAVTLGAAYARKRWIRKAVVRTP